MKTFIAFAIMAFSLNSFADQCSIVSEIVAKRAASQLIKSKNLSATYIKNIQTTDGKVNLIYNGSVQVKTLDQYKDTYQVTVDETPVDLAYTFIKTGPTQWSNLGILTQCNPQISRVSEFLTEKSFMGISRYSPSPIKK